MKLAFQPFAEKFSVNARTVLKGSLALMVVRFSRILVAFATVPLMLNYLGVERYGLWMTVTSLVMMLAAFSDGGVSNAVVTATAKAYRKSGDEAVRVILASAIAILIPVAVIILLISLLVVPFIPWRWVFSLKTEALASEAMIVILVVIVSVVLGFILNIVFNVRVGMQQIPAVAFWRTISVLSTLPVIILAIYLQLNMAWLAAAALGAPLLVYLFGSIFYLFRKPRLIPSLSDVDPACSRDLLAGGSVFLLVAVSYSVAVQSDQVLIANLIGVYDVTTYSVMQRLFVLPWLFSNFLFAAQWPAFTAASSRGDYAWVKRNFIRTVWTTTIFGITFSLVLAVMCPTILNIWLGSVISPPTSLIIGMAAYAVLHVIIGACSTLLISLDVRKEQIWMNGSMMLLNIPLSIYLIRGIGVSGAVLGTIISFLLCMVIPYAFVIPQILRKREDMASFAKSIGNS